jgi:hypothetical protein
MSDRDETPAPDSTPHGHAADAAETDAPDPGGHDVDATITVPGTHSESAAEGRHHRERPLDLSRR